MTENTLLLRRNSVQALFKQYNYDKSSMVHRGTTVGSKQFSSLMIDTQGKIDHDSVSSKKVSELISMGAGNQEYGDENVIEEDD